MTEPQRPLKVFLCHAHADRDAVRALYTRLTNDGVDAWLDKEKLLPGQDWELEIKKAVREADVVAVCLSKQFNQRGFRQKEVRLALDTAMEMPEGEIFIIPARLEECDNLESLRKWHWVDLFEDNGYEMLMRALRARANRIGAALQVKKNWLPKITSPRSNIEKSFEEKKIVPEDSESIEKNKKKLEHETEKLVKNVEFERRTFRRKVEFNLLFQYIRNKLSLFFINVGFYIRPIFLGLVLIVLLLYLFKLKPRNIPAQNSPPTSGSILPTQRSMTVTEFVANAEIFTPSPTSIEIITATSTFLPTGSTDAKDLSMILIPAGKFYMGSSCAEVGCVYKQGGQIEYTEAYWIDKTEVSNAKFAECVAVNNCTPPVKVSLSTIPDYYGNAEYDDYPVVNITFEQAEAYCDWFGGRLPTNKEWEKAARGTDGRGFPWGIDFQGFEANSCDIHCNDLNNRNDDFNDGYKYTAPVLSFLEYQSPFGALNMAGNVREIVKEKDARGGAWNTPARLLWTFSLGFGDTAPSDAIGFRCAKDAP